MAEPIAERVRRYILDGSDQDLRRLLSISQVAADMTRAAFRRVGVQEGWHTIDCGCGPIGALAVMTESVGPAGRIVGVDFSAAAIAQARSVALSLALDNVEVVEGDIHDLDPATVGAPFDLAYTRLFLMHQPNPVKTLRRIADLLRPGGLLIAQEPLRTPAPRSHPDVEALADYWALLHRLLERAGVPRDAVENLPRYAREAGLEVVDVSGYFAAMDPAVGFEIHATTTAAARDRATKAGVATEREIDDLIQGIREAKPIEHEWVSSPFFLDLTLRKPATG
jgi:ubiquinone/menaquinone biosynthesis C-methylase UbiE